MFIFLNKTFPELIQEEGGVPKGMGGPLIS